ncbi:MAG: carbohydrate-binding protein [Methanospirillum sp.]
MLHTADYRGCRSPLAPAAFLLLALCLLAVGVQAEPPAGAVPITNSTVITAPGTYYLAQSLSDLDSPVAISIRAPDVAFDGQDRLLDGRDLAGSIGIEVRPPDGGPALTNVSVANVRLADWATGLDASTAGLRLVNVSAESGGTGFLLMGPGAVTLEGCTAAENAANGIRADGITGDLALALSDVLVRTSGETGIDARLAAVTMTDCNVLENGQASAESSGFRIYKGSATVRDSLFRLNGGSGIFFDTSTSGTVTGSHCLGNGYAGIRDAETAGEGGSLTIYDNYLQNDRNVALGGRAITWSVPKTAGPNIVGGPSIGGNAWANRNGTGFSETHPDADGDGFCDEAYVIADGSTDALPLVLPKDTPRPTSAPYGPPHAVTDRIQAEDYDVGGEGVAYHDTTPGNTGGAYRTDDVDVETANGITNVGWIRNGEWMTYTANVTTAGTYTMTARVASPNSGRTIAVTVDGAAAATIAVPRTGSFEAFRTVDVPVTLAAGTHTLKLAFAGDGQNLDWIAFAKGGEVETPTPEAGGANFTAAPLSAPRGSAVRFTLSPAAGKTVASAWWSFDAPAHLDTWNSRATTPTFFYPAAGSFSPLVKITYTDGSTETMQRTNYVRAT